MKERKARKQRKEKQIDLSAKSTKEIEMQIVKEASAMNEAAVYYLPMCKKAKSIINSLKRRARTNESYQQNGKDVHEMSTRHWKIMIVCTDK